MTSILLAALSAFVLSAVLTQLCKPLATRLNLVSRPRGDRWSARAVPLLGGAAIAGTVFVLVPWMVNGSLQLWAFLGGGFMLFTLGLVDDVWELSPGIKLGIQILVASALAAVGLQLRMTHIPVLDALLTIVWITGVTNAVNLLDNMDGLAAGVAAIGATFRLGFFVLDGNMDGAVLAAIFTGAALGFLVHNFAPASIFMGDAGSLFLGFCLSGLSLVGGYPYSRSLLSVLLLPVLLLLVPIFDTAFVTITRSLARRPVSVGARDHTSHRLVALGLSPKAAVLGLYAVAVLSGLVGVFTYRAGLSYGIVLIVFLGLSIAVLGVYLSRIRVYPEQPAAVVERVGALRLMGSVTHQRQVATFLVDAVLVGAAYYTAYLLRFEDGLRPHMGRMVASLPIVMVCQLLGFWMFRVHQGMWRYVGLHDLVAIAGGALTGTAAAVVAIVFAYRFAGYSRAVFVIDWVLLVGFVAASRLSMRMLGERLRPHDAAPLKVLVYGAGDAGVLVCRELLNNRSLGRTLVGFLDDDPGKRHRSIHGLPILGGADRLDEILSAHPISEVLVASRQIRGENVRRVAGVCDRRGVRLVHVSLQMGDDKSQGPGGPQAFRKLIS